MPSPQKKSELTVNGCNRHAILSKCQSRNNYIVKSDVNPFLHRQLLFTAMDKLRVRIKVIDFWYQ